MPMQEVSIICPCCGHRLVLSVAINAAPAGLFDGDIINVARALGIEVGMMEGGEEIGD